MPTLPATPQRLWPRIAQAPLPPSLQTSGPLGLCSGPLQVKLLKGQAGCKLRVTQPRPESHSHLSGRRRWPGTGASSRQKPDPAVTATALLRAKEACLHLAVPFVLSPLCPYPIPLAQREPASDMEPSLPEAGGAIGGVPSSANSCRLGRSVPPGAPGPWGRPYKASGEADLPRDPGPT